MTSSIRPIKTGIIFHNAQGELASLSLLRATVEARVVDASAIVTFTQVFCNTSELSTPRAKYIFRLPARAAVCAFEMCSQDRLVRGVVKEHGKATVVRNREKEACASLIQQTTSDLFIISVGSIPGQAVAKVTLTFVMVLMSNYRRNEVRLRLPQGICQPYDCTQDIMVEATEKQEVVTITVSIITSGIIQAVSSPSHPEATAVSVACETSHQARHPDPYPSFHEGSAVFSSSEFLASDFVLCIATEKPETPRCFVQRDPQNPRCLAIQLTFRPELCQPTINPQEYIFLLDRSSSMTSESRIDIAKRTLILLLHALPRNGTSFNVVTFDKDPIRMYPRSQIYTEKTLNEATTWVDQIQIGHGSNILQALEDSFRRCSRSIPTTILLLTDGKACNVTGTAHAVSLAVSQASSTAGIQISTLEIGCAASTPICSAISQAGNGECLVATDTCSILTACTKLLRTSVSPSTASVAIDWGIPLESTPAPTDQPPDDTMLFQTSIVVESTYPGHCEVVYAFVEYDSPTIPELVVVHYTRATGDLAVDVEIKSPVVEIGPSHGEHPSSLLHTLAARELITQLEGCSIATATDEGRKASIIRLGEQYQLATQHTSFVPIEETLRHSARDRYRCAFTSFLRVQAAASDIMTACTSSAAEYASGIISTTCDFLKEPYQTTHTYEKSIIQCNSPLFLPGQYRPLTPDSVVCSLPRASWHSSLSTGFKFQRTAESGDEWISDNADSILGSWGDSCSCESPEWSGTETESCWRHSYISIPKPIRSTSPVFTTYSTDSDTTQRGELVSRSSSYLPSTTMSRQRSQVRLTTIFDLIRLQNFDGSYSLDRKLGNILGLRLTYRPDHVDADVWATALVVAYYQTFLLDSRLLDFMVGKAMEWAVDATKSGVDFDGTVEMALEVVSQHGLFFRVISC
ncbi:hypothetical protein BXZ70DRAFT_1016052 [Cristinia sonorae]|uniref:Uncharacterized protein n=1 Tax=Cristinia sonorae TaxID=1940300 RepID=A0A8K0URW3_9AGAR|nr:hypothetical protein BXZ70DRAFT_1016052 [Cristinia sonorae]